jgi:hypothetical protein
VNIREIWCDVVDWIRLSHTTNQKRAFVNTNDIPDSIKIREYFNHLSDCYFFQKEKAFNLLLGHQFNN